MNIYLNFNNRYYLIKISITLNLIFIKVCNMSKNIELVLLGFKYIIIYFYNFILTIT